MKTDLEQLIEAYQQERTNLELEINNSLLQWEYLGAHYYKQGLFDNMAVLRVLNDLKDPNINKIEHLEREIALLRARLLDASNGGLQSLLESREQKLSALKNEVRKPHFDEQAILDAIDLLVKGAYKKIQLALCAQNDLLLTIELCTEGLCMRMTSNDPDLYPISDREKPLIALHRIGFKDCEEGFEMMIPSAKSGSYSQVIEVLARIVYEVFGAENLDNPVNMLLMR